MNYIPRPDISSGSPSSTGLFLLPAYLFAILLVAACSPDTSGASPSPSPPPATVTATQASPPLPRPTPTATPIAPLPPSGPPELLHGLIALSTVGYEGDLYILSLDCLAGPHGCSSALNQMEYPGSHEWWAALSPGGERLAFVSDRGQESGESIYLTELRTSKSRRLTLEPGWYRDLAWAPDGQWLAFSYQRDDGGPQTIATINIEGGGLSAFPQIRERMERPTWSPDGKSIAFLGGDNWPTEPYMYLFVSDMTGTSIRQVGPSLPAFSGPAQWSPQGTQLLASISPQQDLALIDAETSQTAFITHTAAKEYAPSWSPDGEWLAYSVLDEGSWHIEVRNLPGDAVIPVAGPYDQAVGPIWSPDGSFLAFDAPIGEYSQVFIAAPDGSWVRQLTNTDLHLRVESVWTPQVP